MIDGEEEPLELTSEVVEDEPTETGENGTGEEAEQEEAQAEPEKPKGKSVQERIDEIYGQKKDIERDRDYWRDIALANQPKQTDSEPEASKRPDPNDYDYGDSDPAYWEALTDWKAEQKIDAKLKEFSESQSINQQARELDRTYATNVAAAREEFPDYDEKVTRAGQRGEWPCPKEVAGLIKSSPVGPKVAYHLATNLDDAQALANLPPIQQAAAFGMIAAQFVSQPAPKANIATNAPMPAPARTKGGQFAPASELRDDLSQADWLRRRNEQLRSKG